MNILAPLEFVLRYIFEFSYNITKNYGLSLIILSIVVTVGTYPLYHLADIWKKKEDDIQTQMKKEIDEIKRAYKGQKQFYLIQTTYRMHNYKSWYALRAAFGLLIQIPFFFAAYNMLSSYQGYSGHSFLVFNDLAKPESFIFGINLLPILMTVVNVISSIVYSRSLSIKDNKQLLILALVFFVFLYNSPSALLIYWTSNNILSLVKSYFLNKQKKLKGCPDEEKRIILNILIYSLIYSIFILSLLLINHYQHLTKFVLMVNLFITALVVIYSNIKNSSTTSFYKILKSFIFENKILNIFFILFTAIYLLKPEVKIIRIVRLDALTVLLCLYLYILKYINVFFDKDIKSNNSIKKELSFTYICFEITLFILLPLKLFLLAPDEAGCHISKLLIVGFILFIISLLVTLFVINKGSNITISLFSFLIVSSIINFAFPINVGVISGFKLTLHNSITNVSFSNFCKDIFIGFISIIVSFILLKKYSKFIKYFAILIFAITIIQIFPIIKNYNPASFKSPADKILTTDKLPEKYYEMHSLSKDKTNVLYICLDMFNSEYISKMQNDIDNFDEKFRGFTFYKDTLSVSGWTGTSFGGALYYGNEYSPLNNNKKQLYVFDSGKIALNNLINLLNENNFSTNFINDIVLHDYNISAESDFSDFAYYWCHKNNIQLSAVSKVAMLEMFSLFQFVPILLKSYVYDGASWIFYGEKFSIAWNRDNAIKTLSYLDLLPEISSNTSDKSNFLFMRTELPHEPYGIDSNGNLIENEYPDVENESFYSSKAAYNSAKKTINLLINFFNWMKANEVWDNSIIVLFSDHGNNCYDNNIPIDDSASNEERLYISRANALYMIKPLNSKSDFIVDDKTLKSNGDILYDIFNQLGIENDIEPCTKNNIRYYSFMKKLDDLNEHKNIIDYASYEVNGSIFDKDSWKVINSD